MKQEWDRRHMHIKKLAGNVEGKLSFKNLGIDMTA
jgi:hypothetical protein